MLRSRRATILPQCRHGSEPELIHEATAASHGAVQRESARARARARGRERERERERERRTPAAAHPPSRRGQTCRHTGHRGDAGTASAVTKRTQVTVVPLLVRACVRACGYMNTHSVLERWSPASTGSAFSAGRALAARLSQCAASRKFSTRKTAGWTEMRRTETCPRSRGGSTSYDGILGHARLTCAKER
jgi:hypothetical protein